MGRRSGSAHGAEAIGSCQRSVEGADRARERAPPGEPWRLRAQAYAADAAADKARVNTADGVMLDATNQRRVCDGRYQWPLVAPETIALKIPTAMSFEGSFESDESFALLSFEPLSFESLSEESFESL